MQIINSNNDNCNTDKKDIFSNHFVLNKQHLNDYKFI